MGTRESFFTCFHCGKPAVKWNNEKQEATWPRRMLRNESGNRVVTCPHCHKQNVFGEFNPLSLG
jgi:endogenous inhibitor of DNA gyrase (YacG/DUF329 family)